MKIMIVDDNAKMRRHIQHLLLKHLSQQPEIILCSTAGDAVQRFKESAFDWIIMDVKLNGHNGLYAAQQIRKINPAARIIVITQYAEKVYREEAQNCGAFAFVLKDHLNDVISVIKSVL